MQRAVTAAIGIFLCAGAPAIQGQTLKGSPRAMQRQNSVAVQHDYSFLQTSAQVRRFVDNGLLERVSSNANYQLSGVSHPYARPAVKLFVERLAAQYRAACGERLVVTSLTRPVLEQPRNASELSVHPAGMAVDLRVSRRSSCRRWLESTLISLEKRGVLEATHEKRPPHYHVALFPAKYTSYLAQLGVPAATRVAAANAPPSGRSAAAVAKPTSTLASKQPAAAQPNVTASHPATESAARLGAAEPELPAEERPTYRVNRGDSLWSIARRHGITIDALKEVNGLRDSHLVAGQVIVLPVATASAAQPSGS